jgi:malonate transporter MadL subunit
MCIYGTALLSACLLAGLAAGRALGVLLGVDADVGGVGIAMILLVTGCHALHRRGLMQPPTEKGVTFWAQMYVPIVVAMAASQNVLGALSGGVMAVAAGLAVVLASFVVVGLLTRMAGGGDRA